MTMFMSTSCARDDAAGREVIAGEGGANTKWEKLKGTWSARVAVMGRGIPGHPGSCARAILYSNCKHADY
jgi:hypothetical protein